MSASATTSDSKLPETVPATATATAVVPASAPAPAPALAPALFLAPLGALPTLRGAVSPRHGATGEHSAVTKSVAETARALAVADAKSELAKLGDGSLSIGSSFDGKNVLVTGVTGFVAMAVLEKLLRSVPTIGRIYLLIRNSAREGTGAQRLAALLKNPLFIPLRNQFAVARKKAAAQMAAGGDVKQAAAALPESFNAFIARKVRVFSGDLNQPRLGLHAMDLAELLNSVHIVIHSAANTKFLQSLSDTLINNTIATMRLLALFRDSEHAKVQQPVFVYVGTIFCNLHLEPTTIVQEKLYDVPNFPLNEAIELVKEYSNATLTGPATPAAETKWNNFVANIEPYFVNGGVINTYLMSKWLGERVVARECGAVKACIVRPAIVAPTLSDPYPGWVESFGGGLSLHLALGAGLAKVIAYDYSVHADWVPVDYCVNVIIAAAAATAKAAAAPQSAFNTNLTQHVKTTPCPVPVPARVDPVLGDPRPEFNGLLTGDGKVEIMGEHVTRPPKPHPVTCKESDSIAIYHVSTSISNPVSLEQLTRVVNEYFRKFPLDHATEDAPTELDLIQSECGLSSRNCWYYQFPACVYSACCFCTGECRTRGTKFRKTANVASDMMWEFRKVLNKRIFYSEVATQFLFTALSAEERHAFAPITLGSMNWGAYCQVYGWGAADFQHRMAVARTDANHKLHDAADAAAPEHTVSMRKPTPGPKFRAAQRAAAGGGAEPSHTPMKEAGTAADAAEEGIELAPIAAANPKPADATAQR